MPAWSSSMTDTEDLIDALVRKGGAVRRFPSPLAVVVRWGGFALAGIVLFVGMMGVRPDLLDCLTRPSYLFDLAAALSTAIGAAWAAAVSALPGRPLWQRILPAVPAAIWITSLIAGAVTDGTPLRADLICLPVIAGLAVVPCAVLIVAMRRGEVLAPCLGMFLAVAASASLAYAGLRLVHPEDAGRMMLVWQFGPVVLLSAMAACLGDKLLPRKIPEFLKRGAVS